MIINLEISSFFERKIPYAITIQDGLIKESDKLAETNIKANRLRKDAESLNPNIMDDPGIIPSLIRLASSGCKRKDIISWVSKNGFLTVSREWKLEAVSEFVKEASLFGDLWVKLQQVRQPNLELLKNWITFVPAKRGAIVHGHLLEPEYTTGNTSMSKIKNLMVFKEDYDKRANYLIQVAGFKYIMNHILPRLKGIRVEDGENNPDFTVRPRLRPETLLQCLYLQFMIELSDRSKKICPVCFKAFIPANPTQIYCRDSMGKCACKLTQKSRNYRARKASERIN